MQIIGAEGSYVHRAVTVAYGDRVQVGLDGDDELVELIFAE